MLANSLHFYILLFVGVSFKTVRVRIFFLEEWTHLKVGSNLTLSKENKLMEKVKYLQHPRDHNLCTYQCQAGKGGEVGHRAGILTFSKKLL